MIVTFVYPAFFCIGCFGAAFAAAAAAAAAATATAECRCRLAPGGDILHRLNRQNCGYFTLPIARFVIAQVILALEYAPPIPHRIFVTFVERAPLIPHCIFVIFVEHTPFISQCVFVTLFQVHAWQGHCT